MNSLSIRVLGVLLAASLLFPTGALAGPGETIHVVQWGETLSLIADQYGVTVEAIMVANGLANPNFVYAGQRLIIPTSGPGGGVCENHYTVQWGDTLSGIAWHYGTTSSALMQANNLSSDFIYEGQRLCVPSGTMNERPLTPGASKPSPMPGSMPMDPPQYSPEQGQGYSPQGNPGMQPSHPPEFQPPQSTTGMQVSQGVPQPPEFQPPYDGAMSKPGMPHQDGLFVVPVKEQWVGSQTAHNPDPDEITTLIVMTHEKEDVDVMIRSRDGFVARGVTGVYFEFSWIPTFAFRGIPGGEYEIWVEGQPSQAVKAKVNPGHRTLVELEWKLVSVPVGASPSGWIGEVVDNTSGSKPIGAFSILVVKTGNIGNKIRVTAPGNFEAVCITGTKPEHGPGACDVGGLNAGTYQVILDGADVAVEVYLDGIGTAVVEFRPAPPHRGPSYVMDP